MLARPTLTKRPDATVVEKPKGQARLAEERFLLRVDGQTKRSFSSKEAAKKRWQRNQKGLSSGYGHDCR
jgi:hypothetical protein